jgi:subtilisin family serine protease
VADSQRPYFDLMHVADAWAVTRGSPDCIVGVIDTGFDFFHPALKNNLSPGWFAPDVYHTTCAGMIAHGTLVASIIGGRNTEDGGMVGLAPDCPLLAASIGMPEHKLLLLQRQVMEANPNASADDLRAAMAEHQDELRDFGRNWIGYVTRTTAGAIDYLVERKARVINISAFLPRATLERYPEAAAQLYEAFDRAIEADVVIVIGAGNNAEETLSYPGAAETVLVAGATLLSDERWAETVHAMGMDVKQGSNYGPRLSVMAPTQNLLRAMPHYTASYEVAPNGATSSAAPIVASLAALIRSARPDLPARDVIRIVKQGAVDIGDPGEDPMTGSGRVDFAASLRLALADEGGG